MNVAYNSNFITGFIKAAVANGQDPVRTAYTHGRLAILNHPEIRKGFDAVLKQATLSKRTAAFLMQPEKLAGLVDHVINEGHNLLSEELRCHLPEHQELTELFKSAAARAAAGKPSAPMGENFISRFERLPLSDKLTLLGTIGGAVGGGHGVLSPSREDRAYGRGPFSRMMRGAIKGVSTAGGAGLGASLANEFAEKLTPTGPNSLHPLAILLGGGAGALAGKTLGETIL